MTFQHVLLLTVAVSLIGQETDTVWVNRLDYFLVDSFNSGTWVVLSEHLNSMPGEECESARGAGFCGLSEIGEFGEAKWFWYYENPTAEAQNISRGDLVVQYQTGELERAWGVRSVIDRVTDVKKLQKGSEIYVHIQLLTPGTGSHRHDVLFKWRDSHWQEIDTWSWIEAIDLPPCYGIWKGPFIDFNDLSLESDVWIYGDGNCCPSGGKLAVSFEIVGNRLSVADWKHEMGEGSLSDPWRNIDEAKCMTSVK
jgi:hypothetical protein